MNKTPLTRSHYTSAAMPSDLGDELEVMRVVCVGGWKVEVIKTDSMWEDAEGAHRGGERGVCVYEYHGYVAEERVFRGGSYNCVCVCVCMCGE